ncbi:MULTISPECIES: hypothetical protein [unclassified Thermococcus]|uniref:hypothetical protein n=1 Tax=unclassified Thermococcus TaxID=2627626 RepID=UPI001F0D8341|nr:MULTISPECIES: hypothetical protein [unclassified Thermococcus]
MNGSDLKKDDVLKTLKDLGDGDAIRIYEAYLDGRKTYFDEEFLKEFVRFRVGKMRKGL